jgi:hypothetical protein
MPRIDLVAISVALIGGWAPLCLPAQNARDLFNGRDLTGWEVRGDSVWTPISGGILAGTRTHPDKFAFSWPLEQKQFQAWRYRQAWLYTLDNFDEFDLDLEYWIPPGGNSGVSIRDTSRGACAVGEAPTPSHIGYEIQIAKGGKYPSGSVYLFAAAKEDLHLDNAWNKLEIQSRHEMIRVRLNGQFASESPGDPKRPRIGPIGLQLHDQFSWALFRNIRIRTVSRSQ